MEIKKASNEELIIRYVDLNMLKETECMEMEKCDWSKIKKYNDELSIVEDALKERRIELAAEEKLLIEQGKITEDGIDELKIMSTEELELELEDDMQVMEEYYGNMFYLQKYENDESFIKAGNGIEAAISIISLILKDRENKPKQTLGEVTEMPLIAEKAKEVAFVTITNNV